VETIVVALTLQEVQFILMCIKGAPITATVEAMPGVVAMAGEIGRKLNPSSPVPSPELGTAALDTAALDTARGEGRLGGS